MPRYQLAIVDLDKVEADPAVKAGYEGAIILKRTADADQVVAIEDECHREEPGHPEGVDLTISTAARFISNPQAMKANHDPQQPIWNYHLRRTGISHHIAIQKGTDWLVAQADKLDTPEAKVVPDRRSMGDEA